MRYMKKLITLLLVLSALSFANAQGCLPQGITFTNQAQIDDFQSNFPGCSVILGDVNIIDDGSNAITNLNGLEILNTINGNLLLQENYSLNSISGLHNLTYIGGDLTLSFNYFLPSLTGLENLDSIGGDFKTTCSNLIEDLVVFQNLSKIGGNLKITWNNKLKSLDGLENLNLGGGVYLSDNVLLSDLSSLESFTSINGDFYLLSNNALDSLGCLKNLSSIGGNLDINFCSPLINLAGLDSLKIVGGYVNIEDNWYLNNLTGLNALKSIGGSLSVTNNSELNSLNSLYNLNSIGGGLTVAENSFLTSLDGLDNISAASINGLVIANNSSLSTCEVKSICDYLAIPGSVVNISGNAPGCSNRQEVEELCNLLSVPVLRDFAIFLYPNPSSNLITIEFPSPQFKSQLFILNTSGQILLCREIENSKLNIDINNLQRGMYFIKVQGESTVQIVKFIKI